jgi:hypothetical protein
MEFIELQSQIKERFGGEFMGAAGSGGYFYEKGDKALCIPDEDGELAVKLMERSLREGKDLLEEKYKDNVFEYKEGVRY